MSTLSSTVAPAIGAIASLIGVAIGARISATTNARNIEAQERLQAQRFERETRAARLSTIAAMRGLLPLAVAASEKAHHNLRIWEPAVKALSDRVGEPTTVLGFPDEDDWHRVSDAAAEASLGLARLQGLPPSPFENDLNRPNREVDDAQTEYVSRITDIGTRLFEALALALEALGQSVERFNRNFVLDIVNFERATRGQNSLEVTRQDPSSKFLAAGSAGSEKPA